MKKDEFKAYAGSLREKSGKFKRQKQEIQDLRHESSVLSRTAQLLEARHPLPKEMRAMEQKVEKTSLEKAQADSAKGAGG